MSTAKWGAISLILIIAGSASVLAMAALNKFGYTNTWSPYWFISDSNKLLSLTIGVSTFMWFKNLHIPQSKLINSIGATTFGVLLIHANSDAMRQWLWRETIDPSGHFVESIFPTFGYAILSVLLIFTICSLIELIRSRYLNLSLINIAKGIKFKTNKV